MDGLRHRGDNRRMPRTRRDVFAHTHHRRYIVLWDLDWRVLHCTRVDTGASLRVELQNAIDRLESEGWQADGTPEFGFLFLTRCRERRLLMLTVRNPLERSPQSFNPLK
jgi:hypothetical protein